MSRLRSVAGTRSRPRRGALRAGVGLVLAAALHPLAAQPAASAPAARLRLRLERDARRLEVGEVIVVSLEAWVSSWFQAPVDFPATLEAEGALVEQVGGSPDSRFEDFAGQRWTGLVRRYRVLPAQPGTLRVTLPGPLQVLPGGGDGRPRKLAAPAALQLEVRVPAGAEDIQPFVAARQLSLRQRWWPEAAPAAGAAGGPAQPQDPAQPQVGDLVRREVVLVTDSTSPLLPAPDFGEPAGTWVRVQAAQSDEQRRDAAASATLTRRTEAVYALQQPGPAVLPAIEVVWWDLARRQRRVTRLEGRTLQVRPAAQRADPFAPAVPPTTTTAATPGAPALSRGAVLAVALGGSALVAGLLALRRRTRAADSGPARPDPAQAWRRLRRACRAGDAPAADRASLEVLASLDPQARQRWSDDAALGVALAELQRRRFGPAAGPGATLTAAAPWRGDALWTALQRLRRTARAEARAPQLPALHP